MEYFAILSDRRRCPCILCSGLLVCTTQEAGWSCCNRYWRCFFWDELRQNQSVIRHLDESDVTWTNSVIVPKVLENFLTFYWVRPTWDVRLHAELADEDGSVGHHALKRRRSVKMITGWAGKIEETNEAFVVSVVCVSFPQCKLVMPE